jgi:hypothetical protein
MFDVHAPGEYPGYKVVTCTFKYQWGMNVVLPREVLEEAPHVAVEMVAKRLFMALAEQVEQESVKAVQKACKDCGYKVPSTEALDGTVEGMAHTFLNNLMQKLAPGGSVSHSGVGLSPTFLGVDIGVGNNMAVTVKKKSEFDQHVPTKVVGKPVQANVSIQKKKAQEESPYVQTTQEEKVLNSALIPPDKLAHVHVSGTSTINLGNYESAKITVGLTFPTSVDDIGNAYDFASDWVSERMNKALKDVKG